jgi:hydroxymethylbilane synthase
VNRSMTQSPFSLRLGTRGSKLARVQAETVRVALGDAAGIACALMILKTSGDLAQDRPLADIGGKGLFTKELEEALLNGVIDLAVHSMKDVPAQLPSGLAIAAVLPREDVRDAFLSHSAPSLDALPQGARIGTGSVRRAAQIARARPDLEILPLRGNVDTRLAKLDSGSFDAILLAYAGLKRLGLEDRVTSLLPANTWLPALSQGAVGIEIRNMDESVRHALARLNDQPTEIALACERAFQLALDGSCRTPIGGLATVAERLLTFRGEVLAPDGSNFVATQIKCNLGAEPVADAAAAGHAAGAALKPRVQAWLAT